MNSNRFPEAYYSSDTTIQQALDADASKEQPGVRHIGHRAVSGHVVNTRIHPVLWDHLQQYGPYTEDGKVDMGRIYTDTAAINPRTNTIDEILILNSATLKATYAQSRIANQPPH